MTQQMQARELAGLTQPQAATRAHVSLATWRRWEADPTSVSQATRTKCERILDLDKALRDGVMASDANFEEAWRDSGTMTPRQAAGIAVSLNIIADLYINEWLKNPADAPLHTVEPFASFDLRIMVLVNENRAWAAKAAERCDAVADEIERGVLPFDRPGCYFDEVLIAAVIPFAKDRMADMPELDEGIPPREPTGDEDTRGLSDEDWDAMETGFDDQCRFDEWQIPFHQGSPLIPLILANRHPYTWFDVAPGTPSGFVAQLAGQTLV